MDQKELLQRLRQNPDSLQAVMQSQDGQKLMQMLSGSDGGQSLSQAAQQAQGGNTMQMVQMLRKVMSSPEGAALIQRLGNQLQQ